MKANKVSKGKNGKIEFFRFIFSICVVLFHIEKDFSGLPKYGETVDLSFFAHGSICVEFFFLVSGFLMAKSIYKKVVNEETSGKFTATEGLYFLRNKYLAIFPQHMVAFVGTFAAFLLLHNSKPLKSLLYVLDSIPSFFLIQMSGVNYKNPNHVEWYISCMLIAMAILYPLCRKYYYNFTRYYAPVASLLVIGYMIFTTGSLTGVGTWVGVCYKSLLRALAEIALGTTAFEVSRWLSEKVKTKATKVSLTLVEMICFVVTVLFIVSTLTAKYQVYILFVLFVMIAITFADVSYGKTIFNNKFFYFLGKLSLPIYLTQLAAIYIGRAYFIEYDKTILYAVTAGLTILFALIVMVIGDAISKLINKKLIKK